MPPIRQTAPQKKGAKAAKRPAAAKRARKAAPAQTTSGEPGLRILMVASEAVPFSKTGGLADVTTALSKALCRMGHRVTLVTPRYRGAADGEPRSTARAYVGGQWHVARLLEAPFDDGARALLVDAPALYDRPAIYGEANGEYADNPLRYAFLTIAALEWASQQPEPFSAVHVHDWQTGLMPVYARQYYPQLNAPFVLTIHNLAYQGAFDKSWVPRLGLRWEDFSLDGFEFYDRLSFLKAGINFSDALTTVSPTYADEIQTPEFGYGFDGIIRSRRQALTGILNGIDTDEWDPTRDRHLPVTYDAEDLDAKTIVKRALLDAFGLPSDDQAMARPVIGIVSRLVDQKGMDLIEAVAPQLAALDASFAVVGSGDPYFETMWRQMAAAHPTRIGVLIGFDERRAHLVEGGADIFLMPSRYEPCGLNQMYSLRYGTVPIVRAVGGLADTVRQYDPETRQGDGFRFTPYRPDAMLAAIQQALEVYRQPRAWRRLQVNGMRKDFSWERSAAEYVRVYKGVMATRQNTRQGRAAS